MKKELWRPVVGFEGLYDVSNLGRVRSLNYNKTGRCKLLKLTKNGSGYLNVHLSKDGKAKIFLVHRLVAKTFIPNPNNLPFVNHKDENPLNNCVENLEWCTLEYNFAYGTAIKRRAEKRSKAVLQFTRDGEFVREWSSATECGRNGFCQKHVSACCNGYRHTHNGFVWKFKEE